MGLKHFRSSLLIINKSVLVLLVFSGIFFSFRNNSFSLYGAEQNSASNILLFDDFVSDANIWIPSSGAWVREGGEYRHKEIGVSFAVQNALETDRNILARYINIEARPSHLYLGAKSTVFISSNIYLDNLHLEVTNPLGRTWRLDKPKGCVGYKNCSVTFPDDFPGADIKALGTYKLVATSGSTASYILLCTREKPIATFIHITDVHALSSGTNLDELRNFVYNVNDQKDFPRPNFVVVTGDITEHGTLEELVAVKKALDALAVPYYPTNGGHDIMSESDGACGKNWAAIFGKNKFSYSWTIGNFIFIAVDVQSPFGGFGAILSSEKHKAWLKNLLKANKDKYAFLFSHFTLESTRDAGVGKDYWSGGFAPFFPDKHSDEVRKILESDSRVIAQFGGHSHLNGAILKNGIYYVQTTGFDTMDEYRYIEVYKNRIESHMFKKSIYNYDLNRSYWMNSTDSTHNAALYGYGLPRERQFKIYYSTKKDYILSSIATAGKSDWQDYTYQVDINLGKEGGVGENVAGVVFRYTDEDNYYFVSMDSPFDIIRLMKKEKGEISTLAVQPAKIDQDITYRLKTIVKGNSIKVYLNGDLKIEATDPTFRSGKIGFRSYRASTSYDNVLVTVDEPAVAKK